MRKISDSIKKIIDNQPYIKYGLSQKIINLSSLSRLIKSYLEAETKKDITENALIMNLSRIKKDYERKQFKLKKFIINNLVIQARLCIVVYPSNKKTYEKINNFYIKNKKYENHIMLNHRETEINIILNKNLYSELKKIIKEKPINYKTNLSSIGIKFDSKYYDQPGLFLHLIQQVSLGGINIWEISSSYSELILYLDEKEMPLALEALNKLLK